MHSKIFNISILCAICVKILSDLSKEFFTFYQMNLFFIQIKKKQFTENLTGFVFCFQ